MPPLPAGRNGWRHTLVVHDQNNVVVAAVDAVDQSALLSFAAALNDACANARREPPLGDAWLDAYQRHCATSWIALERARNGIRNEWMHIGTMQSASYVPMAAPLPLVMGRAVPEAVPTGSTSVPPSYYPHLDSFDHFETSHSHGAPPECFKKQSGI